MIYHLKTTRQIYDSLPLVTGYIGVDHDQEPVMRMTGIPIWQLFWCISGAGELMIENTKCTLRKGQAALLFPDSGHSYRAIEGDWKVHFIGFGGKICQSVLDSVKLKSQGIYQVPDPGFFEEHIHALQKIITGDKDNRSKQLLCTKELFSLLVDLGNSSTRIMMSEFIDNTGYAQEISMYLENNYMDDISLDDLAKTFGRTREYLCTAFKEAAGETIMQHLTKIRIVRARLLLVEHPDLTGREVGERCGFRDASYFGKIFRKYTGMTPNEYRRSIR